jgi:hypothetical protein
MQIDKGPSHVIKLLNIAAKVEALANQASKESPHYRMRPMVCTHIYLKGPVFRIPLPDPGEQSSQ